LSLRFSIIGVVQQPLDVEDLSAHLELLESVLLVEVPCLVYNITRGDSLLFRFLDLGNTHESDIVQHDLVCMFECRME